MTSQSFQQRAFGSRDESHEVKHIQARKIHLLLQIHTQLQTRTHTQINYSIYTKVLVFVCEKCEL